MTSGFAPPVMSSGAFVARSRAGSTGRGVTRAARRGVDLAITGVSGVDEAGVGTLAALDHVAARSVTSVDDIGGGATDEDVVSDAADHDVGLGPALERVPAIAADQHVAALASDEAVVPAPSPEQVAARATDDPVVASPRIDPVVAAPSKDAVTGVATDDVVGLGVSRTATPACGRGERRGSPEWQHERTRRSEADDQRKGTAHTGGPPVVVVDAPEGIRHLISNSRRTLPPLPSRHNPHMHEPADGASVDSDRRCVYLDGYVSEQVHCTTWTL